MYRPLSRWDAPAAGRPDLIVPADPMIGKPLGILSTRSLRRYPRGKRDAKNWQLGLGISPEFFLR